MAAGNSNRVSTSSNNPKRINEKQDKCGRRFGKSGGKGGPSSYQHRPVRRGPPAIFVTCETGREKKCQREALDLIHHYYYSLRPSVVSGDDDSITCPKIGSTKEDSCKRKSTSDGDTHLSLEEELAMLRKGATADEVLSYNHSRKRRRCGAKNESNKQKLSSMKSPFSIYDAGIKGMVCIVCTLPGCEFIPYNAILEKVRDSGNADADGSTVSSSVLSKDSEIKEGDEFRERLAAAADNIGEESTEFGENKTNDATKKSHPVWDPVETVRLIMAGVSCANSCSSGKDTSAGRKNDSLHESDSPDLDGSPNNKKETKLSTEKIQPVVPPPGSRFITRMIPIQATCFASVQEINLVVNSLLDRFISTSIDDSRSISENGKMMTFKIDFKRRICSHLTRDQVIGSVTPTILGTKKREDENEATEKNKSANDVNVRSKAFKRPKFSVNLTDPDFSIRIEICKTLCGISILPRESWYRNFNLAELGGASSKS